MIELYLKIFAALFLVSAGFYVLVRGLNSTKKIIKVTSSSIWLSLSLAAFYLMGSESSILVLVLSFFCYALTFAQFYPWNHRK